MEDYSERIPSPLLYLSCGCEAPSEQELTNKAVFGPSSTVIGGAKQLASLQLTFLFLSLPGMQTYLYKRNLPNFASPSELKKALVVIQHPEKGQFDSGASTTIEDLVSCEPSHLKKRNKERSRLSHLRNSL